MRTILSAVLTLAAMAAIVLAVPSWWVNARLVDSNGFASTMRPVAEQKVRDYMTEQITQGVIDRTGGSGSFTGGVTSAFVTPLARAYTNSAEFKDDFVAVVSDQHDYLFNKPAADGREDHGLELDIAPMVNRVLKARRSGADVPAGAGAVERFESGGRAIPRDRPQYRPAGVRVGGCRDRRRPRRVGDRPPPGPGAAGPGPGHDSRRRRQLRGGRGGRRPRQGRTHRRRGFGPCGERGDRRHRARQSA